MSSKDDGVIQTVSAHGKALVKLGLRAFIPSGCYGRIAPRSSLSWKNHADVVAGVIDPDYEGELVVVIFNHSETDLVILPRQRIAQLILERCETPPVYEAKVDQQTGLFDFHIMDDIDNVRGRWGFGSTGDKRLVESPSPEEGEICEEKKKEGDDLICINDDADEFRIIEKKAKTR